MRRSRPRRLTHRRAHTHAPKCLTTHGRHRARQIKDLPPRANLYPIEALQQKRRLNGHIRKVQGMSWGADSRSLIASDQGSKTIIWDLASDRVPMKRKVISRPFIIAVAMHPTRDLVAIGGMDNVVSVWSTDGDGAECSMTRQLEQHDGYISSLHFPDESQMLSAGGDAEAALWDVATWKAKQVFRGHEGDCSCIRFPAGVPGSQAFCTSSSDGTARVWDMRSGECTHKFDVVGECNGCAFFPSGTAVAAGTQNGSVFLFDLRAQAALQKYSRKNNHVTAVDFSQSGRTMYVAYEDGHVCLWDPLASSESGYAKKVAAHVKNQNHDSRMRVISCMQMSPDGTCLATGAFDATICLWGPGKS